MMLTPSAQGESRDHDTKHVTAESDKATALPDVSAKTEGPAEHDFSALLHQSSRQHFTTASVETKSGHIEKSAEEGKVKFVAGMAFGGRVDWKLIACVLLGAAVAGGVGFWW